MRLSSFVLVGTPFNLRLPPPLAASLLPDLKSANLLLDDCGQVKIGDFGLSRLCQGAGANLVNQVMTGGLGTWAWMAPEVSD